MMMMMMMMVMMIMNCFCGMVDRRKAFSLISSQDHCQRSSPSWISDMLQAGFKPAQNLSSGFVEWSCAVVITTTPRRHSFNLMNTGMHFLLLIFQNIFYCFWMMTGMKNVNNFSTFCYCLFPNSNKYLQFWYIAFQIHNFF